MKNICYTAILCISLSFYGSMGEAKGEVKGDTKGVSNLKKCLIDLDYQRVSGNHNI